MYYSASTRSKPPNWVAFCFTPFSVYHFLIGQLTDVDLNGGFLLADLHIIIPMRYVKTANQCKLLVEP